MSLCFKQALQFPKPKTNTKGRQIWPPHRAAKGPATPLIRSRYLVGVQSPELKFLFEQRTTHVGRVVQLSGPVVVEYLREDARMSVEEVLVEYRVVVGQGLGQPRQPRGRDLLQGGLVGLVSQAAHVEYHAFAGVRRAHGHRSRGAPFSPAANLRITSAYTSE